jgi:subtilisin family serine protease
MSCCTPAGLIYLRNLLRRRHDIAVFPPDALDQDEPPETVYFYRPGEILVPADEVGEFEAAAKRLRLRYSRLDDSPQKGSSSDVLAAVYREARNRPELVAFFQQLRDRSVVARFVVSDNGSLDDLLNRLQRVTGDRLHVSPNHVWFSCPEWHLNPHGDPKPYPYQTLERQARQEADSAGVTVAVVDSGLPQDYHQNAILAAVTVQAPEVSEEEAWDYRDSTKVLKSPDGHGSFVAGVVRLTAPSVDVLSYLTLDPDGVVDQTDLIARIALALGEAPNVVNLSLGGPTRNNHPPLGFRRAAAAASEPGGPIFVAAAGNLASSRPFWPAAEAWVIAVGAVQMIGDPPRPLRATFSNFGRWVEACANGVDVVSSYEANAYQPGDPLGPVVEFDGAATWSGTSFASPKVAALIAAHISTHPNLTKSEALTYLASLGGGTMPGLGVFVP